MGTIYFVCRRSPALGRCAVFALYYGMCVQIYLDVAGTNEFINVEAGIKRACPTSGSLWAIAYDPTVRLLCGRIPPHIGRLTCFAFDLAVATWDVVIAFVTVLACFEYITAASCLRLDKNKTVVIDYLRYADSDLSDALSDVTEGERSNVSRAAKYLGTLIGPDAGRQYWHEAFDEFSARVRQIASWGPPGPPFFHVPHLCF